jgi:hypothetical protein
MARLMMRKLRWALGGAAVLAVVAVAAGLIFRGEYASVQAAKRSFTIEQDFTIVRKILVRKDAAKQIVAMGGTSEFIRQDWTSIGLDASSILDELVNPDWKLELHGDLRVRTKDPYIGEHVIRLDQEVEITPDRLHSHVRLDDPAERLRQYNMTTHFERDGGGSRVDLELKQEILTDAPWFAHGIADRRVLASVEQTLENQEAAIRRLIEENLDNVPVFPLR